jgi:hypothetical protein
MYVLVFVGAGVLDSDLGREMRLFVVFRSAYTQMPVSDSYSYLPDPFQYIIHLFEARIHRYGPKKAGRREWEGD